jgi:small conductance mechanosensitive channel
MNIDLQRLLLVAILRIAGGILILLLGRWLAAVARRLIHTTLQRTHATPSLAKIVERTLFYAVLSFAIFVALVIFGIPAEVLITIIGVIVVVAAIALRESLRDLAATVIFVVFQPFEVGDLIETNGVVGQVQEILLFNTVLTTLDNRKLIIPNGNIQNSNLINFTAQDKLRLDLSVPLSYGDELGLARETLLEIAHADTRVLAEPPPVVDVMEFGERAVGLVLRVYTIPDDYWGLRPALNEQIKLEFDRRRLTMPFPHLDVHVDQTSRA